MIPPLFSLRRGVLRGGRRMMSRVRSSLNYMSGLQPSASGWNVTWGCAPGWYMSGLRPYFNATSWLSS